MLFPTPSSCLFTFRRTIGFVAAITLVPFAANRTLRQLPFSKQIFGIPGSRENMPQRYAKLSVDCLPTIAVSLTSRRIIKWSPSVDLNVTELDDVSKLVCRQTLQIILPRLRFVVSDLRVRRDVFVFEPSTTLVSPPD